MSSMQSARTGSAHAVSETAFLIREMPERIYSE